ncbi:MAG: flagellar protein FlaG [Clostridium sp.]|nr:flagellar protein FlaG [Clostridium sp.]
MGITDVTAGGVKPVRIETPQVSSPAPQHAPKAEVKTAPKAPAQTTAPQNMTPSVPDAAGTDTTGAVRAADTVRVAVQTDAQSGQTGMVAGSRQADAENGASGAGIVRSRGAERANRLPAQGGQQVSGQQAEKKEPSEQESYYEKVMAEKAMENAEERLRSLRHNVRFGYNDDIERYTITITDADDQEVVKEIPSEEIQKMIEHLHTMKGMMFDTEI